MRGVVPIALAMCALTAAGCRYRFDAIDDGGGGGASGGDAPRLTFDGGACPPGYLPAGTRCYRWQDDVLLSWLAAEADCEDDADGAHLAIIDDAQEQSAVDTFLPPAVSDPWFGVSDRVTEGTYLTVTNSVATFFDWSAGEPTGGQLNNCLFVDSGQEANDAVCDEVREYVCEYDGVVAVPAAYTP